jgi:hypothetical protein
MAAFSVRCIVTRTHQWRNPSLQVYGLNGWIGVLICFWLGPSWTFLSRLIPLALKCIKFFLTMACPHLYLRMKCHHLFLPHQLQFRLRRIHPKTRLHLSFLPFYLSTVESHMNTMVHTTQDSLLTILAGPTILVLRHISRIRWRIGASTFPICLLRGWISAQRGFLFRATLHAHFSTHPLLHCLPPPLLRSTRQQILSPPSIYTGTVLLLFSRLLHFPILIMKSGSKVTMRRRIKLKNSAHSNVLL